MCRIPIDRRNQPSITSSRILHSITPHLWDAIKSNNIDFKNPSHYSVNTIIYKILLVTFLCHVRNPTTNHNYCNHRHCSREELLIFSFIVTQKHILRTSSVAITITLTLQTPKQMNHKLDRYGEAKMVNKKQAAAATTLNDNERIDAFEPYMEQVTLK